MDFLRKGLTESPEFDKPRFQEWDPFLGKAVGEAISAADMLHEFENRTPNGLRIYQSAERLYDRRHQGEYEK